jgi:hypothetical protein
MYVRSPLGAATLTCHGLYSLLSSDFSEESLTLVV